MALALLAACNSQPAETKEQAGRPQATDPKTNPATACYRYANQGDTVTLNLIHVNDDVTTGTLMYRLKEKDANTGTLQGSVKGDLFVGNYTFTSEGTLSTRQVAFKKTGNAFIEGYGESIEENGAMKFKNIDSLNFGSSIILEKVACN
ncbi:hypothetical protein A4R26_16360 [Niastella populi]|uniref:Uncharacterized protein n=2 Tax=Niastella populi TaxID=550983 RepID=A0A1V9G288_9BACT|nr:hypothetical protein A4R26_16360 [Niastella populi]